MSNRDTERLKNRDKEKSSLGDMKVTQETEVIPPLAASVKTLPEAVQLSIKDGMTENCLFIYSRAIRAFEITTDRRLPENEIPQAFSLWWNTVRHLLPTDADFDEWRFDFEDTFAKTKVALGANPIHEAIRRADSMPFPPHADRYASPKLKRLVAVCYHLQFLQGNSPFFLGVRDAARILDIKNLFRANAKLGGLCSDGLLIEVEKGTSKRATRYRFKLTK
jgi:hypothetical protein